MIVYEVNLEIKVAIFDAYISWLKPHIKDLLALDGFIKADLLFDVDSKDDKETRKITVAYYLKDYDTYSHYVTNHANQMREDALKRFNGQFNASRRVLKLEDTYFL
ncbi:DUF4286 family protein [Legionella jamestowniensis]|uniref:DUF4286 domain-containing protein n=1 Tax=Legionella jamestowniensis TaxID=455 RepID=A0A0W0V0X9_9GAMM|nr:DUF4286 family protein [Legionella jamestowniensis]KTD13369.1 hypothetical protein Ljam_0159 [Legionella jamestowniensis]OCH98392.1 hypothetical protein A8135_12640 [Legionella jamestowniensis]SFL76386.1 protein of unknown function [Legionella jamestowniensis DSM 19215]